MRARCLAWRLARGGGRAATAIAGLAAYTTGLHAQRLKPPSFVFEPGVITTNAVSAPLPTMSR